MAATPYRAYKVNAKRQHVLPFLVFAPSPVGEGQGEGNTNEKLIMFDTLSKAGKYLGQAAKMMIGVPDYDNYVEHMRVNHPDQTPMTYEEFFRDRQDARYGGKGGAKCC